MRNISFRLESVKHFIATSTSGVKSVNTFSSAKILFLSLFLFAVGCTQGNKMVDDFLGEPGEDTPSYTLDIDPVTYDFGSLLTTAPSPVTKIFTVTNMNTATMFVNQVIAPATADFTLDTETCTTRTTGLVLNDTCTFTVSFKPTTQGAKSDAITLKFGTTNVDVAFSATANLTGFGALPATLLISDGPTYDFGLVVQTAIVEKTFTVTNTGNLTASSIVGGGLASPYAYKGGAFPGTGGTCGTSLAAGVSCTTVVTFNPIATGLQSDSIDIDYDNGDSTTAQATRAVQGTGSTPAVLALSDSPGYDYGTKAVGSVSEHSFTLTNSGGVPATSVSGAGLGLPFAFKGGAYPGTGGTCASTLANGATCTLVVTYSPTSTGSLSDAIDVSYFDGLNAQSESRAVQGTAVPPALLTVSDGPTYNYGTQIVGSATDYTFSVNNTGGLDATFVTGTGLATPYAFKGGTYPGTGGTCGISIAPAATCTVVVTYTPVAAGATGDSIEIQYSNGVNTQTASRAVAGTAVLPANLTITDGPTYNYGTQPTGITVERSFTVSNNGGIIATSVSGGGLAAPFDFKGGTYPGTGGTCAATIAAGSNCTVIVTYAPTTNATHTDSLDMSYNNGLTTVSSSRALQGVGVAPASLSVSDGPTYDFGSRPIGLPVDKTFTITNGGGFGASGINGSGLATPFAFKGGGFPGTGGNCAATLAASASCTVVVTYTATGTGLSSDQLDIGYNNGVSVQTASRAVDGTGVNPGLLVISDGPTFDFGTIATGASAEKVFTVTNSGQYATSAMLGTGLAAPFTFKGGSYPGTGGDCGLTLSPAATCTVVVRYTPTTVAGHLDTLEMTYNNGVTAQTSTRSIQGIGALPASIAISDSPSYNYGSLPVGISVTKSFTLTNNGGVTANSMTGTGLASPYQFVGGSYPGTAGTCGATLAAAATCTIVVEYNPVATGASSDTIVINYNTTVSATSSSRDVSGTAVNPGLLVVSNGPTFDFGTTAVGGTKEQILTVSNSGQYISSAISGGGLAAPYDFKGASYPGTGGTCAATLNAAASCTIVVTYSPTATGVQSDAVELSYNNGVSVQLSTRAITGTGAAPASLALSDGPTYDYGSIAAGGTADKSFTLTNSGGVTASSIAGSGLAAPFGFKGGSYPGTGGNCAATLAASASCTIVVSFNPTVVSTPSDTIDIAYNDGVMAQSTSRNIQGTAVPPALLAVSDGPTFSFGTLPSGGSSEYTFTISNSGSVSATAITGSGLAAPFTFKGGSYPGTAGTCGSSLGAAASCTIVVVFAPTTNNTFNDTIDINYTNGAAATVANRDITGVGAPAGLLVVSDGPTFNFGSWPNGSTQEKTFTVQNTGGVSATAITGGGLAAPFAFKGGSYPGTAGTCSTSLASSATCTIVLEFSPSSIASFSDAIELTFNNGLLAGQVSSRAVQGTSVAPANLTVSDGPTYDYGTLPTGGGTNKTFTITNIGDFAASSVAGTGLAAPFTFLGGGFPGTGGTCTANLNAGNSCTIVVRYAPTATGVQSDTIDINYNNGVGPQTSSRNITGTGADPALLSISDGATYDYGTLASGATADKSFTINNSGGVSAATIAGSGLAAPFSFKGGAYPGTGGTCTTTLAASASCSIVVTYSPTAAGAHSDTINITYNDGVNSQGVNRDVQGTAVLPATLTISDGPTYNFGTLATGAVGEKSFTVINSGQFAASGITGSGLAAPYEFKAGSYPGAGGTCGASIGAGASCTIILTYSPVATGVHTDTAELNYNNGASAQIASRALQGTGAAPASITVSDGPTYNFGTRATGSSTDKTFTLANTGGVAATSLSAGGLAAPYQFKGGSYPGTGGTCAAAIPALGNCTVIVTYAPTATGLQADAIDVAFNDGVTTQNTSRAIQGTGAAPASLAISETDPYDFGTVAAGSTSDKLFTVTNSGGVTATSVSGGGLAAPYSFKGGTFPGTGGNCTANLNASASCNIVVNYAPSIAGTNNDTIDLSYNDGVVVQAAARDLTGIAVAPAFITISDGATFDYGAVPTTGSVDKTFTLQNTGNVGATSIGGSGLAAPYTFKGGSFPGTGGNCATSLNVSQSCTIVVTFNPTATGSFTDSIDIGYYNGASMQTSSRPVSGTGALPATLTISDATTYNFGTVARGSTTDKTFTVTNGGGVTATSIAGSGLAAPYTFKGGSFPGTGATCTATLNAAANCTIIVTFNPLADGVHADTIDLTFDNGLSGQTSSRPVTGTAVAPATIDISDAATYDYGTVATGANIDKSFTLTNNGAFVASAMSGAGLAAPFTYKGGTYPGTGGNCSATLNPAASCSIVVRYSPTSTGAHSDTVEINYYDGANGQTSLRGVQGLGAAPALLGISESDPYDYGTLASGGSADKSFTITNSGGVPAVSVAGTGLAAPYSFKGGSFPGTGGNCTATLAAGSSCTTVVTYNPSGVATHTDTIVINYNDAVNAQSISRDLTGTAVAPASINISNGPTYNFGTLANGATAEMTFTLSNSGSFQATAVGGSGLAAPFTFKGGGYPGSGATCGSSLNAGASCTVIVVFAPTVSGLHADAIDIGFNDGAAVQSSSRAVQGTGAAPASLAISETGTYDFGTRATGSSTDKLFTVTNSGGVAATAVAGTGLAAPYTFKGGSYPGTGGGDCGSTIAAGATCSIVVTYAPVGTGVQSDTVEVGYNDGVTTQNATRPVTGTGAAPASLAISETNPWDFGSIAMGGSADKSFTISNSGGVSATSVSGAGIAAPFTFKGGSFPGTGGNCTATILAAGSCSVVVTFAPQSAGLLTDTLDITYNNGVAAGQTSSRDVQGTGVTPAILAVSDGPGTFNFGTIASTASLDYTFTVSNSGSLTATTFSGTGLAAPFTFKGGTYPGTGGTCGSSLNAAQSCTVVVTFNPTVNGSYNDTLDFPYHDGAQAQTASRALSGAGAAPASLSLSDGPTFSFGTVANGSTTDKTFTLANGGGVSATAIAGSGLAAPYSFKGGSFPGTGGSCVAGGSLAAAANCTVVVTYNPSTVATHTDTIDVTFNNGLTGGNTATRDLTGTAVPPAVIAISDATTYDYGTVPTGGSADKLFTISNTGGFAANSLSGSGIAAPFAFKGGSYPGTGGNCGATLNAGSSCSVVVTYSPVATGLQSDALEMNYYDGAASQMSSRGIQGTGAAPALLTVSDGATYDYGTVANGSSTDKSFTVTNTGGVPAVSVAGTGLAAPYSFKNGTFPGTGGNCSSTLAATASCTIVVTYNPTTVATHNDSIDINYNDGVNNQSVSRPVTGIAVAPATLSLSDGPTYHFPTLANGANADKVITVTNSGAFAASSMTGGGLAAPFGYKNGTYPGTGGSCATSLVAAGSCTIVVSFVPTVSGTHTDTIEINYNNGAASGFIGTRDVDGVSAAPALLTVSDGATYDFGTRATGSSTDKSFTIQNTGGVAATSLAGVGLAAPYTFKGGGYPGSGGDCSTSLGAGSSCTVIVTYAPSATGVQNDQLDMTYNDGVAGQTSSRPITGTGAAPATIAITDGPTYNFGSIAVGGSADKSFTLQNNGGVPATSLSGSGLGTPFTFKGGGFPGTGGNCTATLAATATCTVVVTYAPVASGVANDTMDITFNNGVSAGQSSTRDLTGTGVAPALLNISDAATYDFGTIASTASLDHIFTVTNTGDLTATGISGGGLAAPFTYKGGGFPGTGGNCGTTLAPAGSCSFVVTFNPTANSSYNDTIDLNYNDGALAQTASRPVQGAGAAPASINITDGPTYNFGTLANGGSAEKTLTLSNAGGVPATSLAGAGLAAPFSFKGGSFPGSGGSCVNGGTIAAAASCTVIIVYSPTTNATHNDTMDITFHNGLSAGQTSSRDVQGTAVPPASLSISHAATYDFGTHATGASTDGTFTVTNGGSFTASGMAGAGLAAPFTFKNGTYPGTGGNCSTTLAPAASCTIVVTYAPTATGTQSDSIEVNYNDGANSQTATRGIQGTGAAPALLALTDGPTYDFGILASGGTADKTFTLNNSGGVPATGISGSGLAAPYTFKGGGFPGTGGNCGTSLAASGSCLVVVTYNPSAVGTHTDTIVVDYTNGVSAQSTTRDLTGQAVAPASLGLSDGPTYHFPALANGATADHTFTITNSGSFNATGIGGSGLAAPFVFKGGGAFPGTGGSCGSSLAASGTCTFVLTFAPTVTGTHTDTVDVGYNNGATAQTSSRDIDGVSAAPALLSVSGGPTYDFGTRATGSSTDATFTITNGGGVTATSVNGSGIAAPYTFKGGSYPGTGGGNCGTSLASGASCFVVVTYAPSATGVQNDTLDMTYNDGVGAQTSSRPITGTGASPATIAISGSDPVNFGSIATGGNAELTFTLSNSGGVNATSVSGSGLAAPYTFKGGSFPGTGTCTATLAPAANCTVIVVFAPTVSGVQGDTMDITFNNGVAGGQTSSRVFTGTGVAPALLTVSDGATFDFGTIASTASVDKVFTISNSGDLQATGIGGSGLAAPYSWKGGGAFPGTGGTCGATLNGGGATCTFIVTFNPTVNGSYNDQIVIGYNDGAAAANSTRDVQGAGASPASITISDATVYNFGTLANGGVGEKALTLTNSGGVPATSLAGAGLAAPFSFKGGSFPGTGGSCISAGSLAATAQCTVVVVYSPSTIATHNDTMDITFHNGLAAGQTSSRDLTGSAVAPASLAVSHGATYDFGTLATGATAEMTFTITNSGAYTAGSMTGSGLAAPFQFKNGTYPGTGGNCSTSLAPAGTCTIVVSYNPSATGTQSDSIEINYNDGANNQMAPRAVQGTGAAPALLTLTDGPTYNFGTLASGGTADKTFQLSNSGGVPATGISGSGLAAPYTFKGGGFPGTGGNCGTSLAPSTSCNVVVTYSPSTVATHTDTILVDYTNGVSSQQSTRDLTGTAVAPASLAVSHGATFSFPTLANGATFDHTFTITNSGSFAAASVNGTGLAAPFIFKGGGAFPGTGGSCTSSLAAAGTCTFIVTFAPTVSGTHTDTVDIGYNNGATAQTASRDMDGVSAPPATIVISDAATYDFGTRATGSSTDKTFTIQNTGGVAATSLGGSGLAAPYTFKGGTYPGTGGGDCGTSLAAGASCFVVVTYAPTATGVQNDQLDVTFNDGVTGQTSSRPITGTGATPASLAISDGATYNYGSRATGSSTDKVFTITNSGGVNATSVSGSGLAAPFSFKGGSFPGATGTCTATIAPGTCTIVVTYAPVASGLLSDTIELTYGNGVAGGQSSTRDIQGTGVAPALLTVSDGATFDYGTIASTATVDKTFTITNSGDLQATTVAGSGLAAPFSWKGGGAFPGSGGTCGGTLNGGGTTCTFVVTFNPSVNGSYNDTIDIAYNDGAAAASTSRDIQGAGANPASLTLSAGPTFSFGSIANGATVEGTITITNGGGVQATSMAGSGLASPFLFKNGTYPGTGGTCGTTLGATLSCTVVLTYSPGTVATHNDTLDIDYDNGLSAQQSSRNVTGTAVAPASLAISHGATFDYGTLATGATLDQTFTITNSGAVTATSITGSGLAAPFTFKNGTYPGTGGNCSTSLNSAATCTIVVTYAPTATGTQSDAIDINYHNGASATSSSRSIQGTGANPATLTISDGTTFDFGNVANGSSNDKTFTINNTGGVPATGITGSGLAAPYTFKGGGYPGSGGNCSTSLGASGSCTIVVTYAPTSNGVTNDQVDIDYNDGVSAQQVVRPVTGTAVGPAVLNVSGTNPVSFGTIATGATADHTFTISNSGGFTASVVTGTGLASPFTFKGGTFPGSGGNCAATIAPAGSCLVVVTYAPVSTGSHSDTMDITYNNGASGQTSSRNVEGIGAPPASLTLSGGPTVDFGTVANTSTNDATITVTNGGGVAATALSGSGLSAPYSFKGGTFPGTGGSCVNAGSLGAGANCTIVVNYSPSTIATHNATVSVGYNDGASAQSATRNLTGTAVAPASLSISGGPTYDFGTLATGSNAEATFTITNGGGITATTLAGSGLAAPYTFKGGSYPGTGTCSASLAPAGTCTIIVVFAPVSNGTLTDTIDITYNDGANAQTAQRPLTGVGVAPASLSISGSNPYDYGTIANGGSADGTFTITNGGGMTASSLSIGGIAAPFTFKGGSYPGTGGNCATTIVGGGNCLIVVTFAPTGTGGFSDSIDVNYNNGVSGQSVSRNIQGVGAAPASLTIAGVNPFDFGTKAVGSSNDGTITVTNGGGVAATGVGGTGLAAPYTFKDGTYPGTGGTCSNSISAAASCTIVVTWAPTITGSQTDTLDVNYNNGVTGQTASRDFQGVGANPATLNISDAVTYSFGTVAAGSSNSHTFTITNGGGVQATSMNGSGLAAPFTFAGGTYPGGGTCTSSLNAGGSCTIIVNYSPSAAGSHTDSIDIGFNNGAAGGQTSSRGVAGTAVAPALLTVSGSGTFDFGTIANGAAADGTFTITNSGSLPANLIDGTGLAAPFSYKGGTYPGTLGTCSTSLAASGTCTIVVRFAPGSTGFHSDTIVIDYDDGAQAQSATRDVIGTSAGPAVLTIGDGPTYDYLTVATTGSKDKTFTVSNSGGVPATSLAGGGLAAPYAFVGGSFPGGGTCTATLGGGSSCTIIVRFQPTTNGTHNDTVDLTYNNGVAGGQTTSRDLTGVGAAPALLAITGGPTFDYGSVVVGGVAENTFTISNSGGMTAASLLVNGLASPFDFKGGGYPGTGGNCGGTLNAAANCTIVVTYTPGAASAHSDSILIAYNDGAVVQNISRDIQGTGSTPANLVVSETGTWDYGTLAAGGNASKTFTINNTGGFAASSIAGTGLAAPFSFFGGTFPGGGTCTTSLGASASCTFVVVYAPGSAGTHNDQIDITYNNGVAGGQTASRPVTGIAVSPASLAISDGPTYDFGNVFTGVTVEHIFTVTNSGAFSASSVAGTGIVAPFVYKGGGGYPGTGGTCTNSLAGAGATCSFVVTYTPAVAGLDGDVIDLNYNDGANLQTAQRTVAGTGVTPIPPAAPTGLTIAATQFARLDLSWTGSASGSAPITYSVLQSTISGSGYSTIVSGLTGTTYNDTGVTAGVPYYYKIQADGLGGTAQSTEASGTAMATFGLTAVTGRDLSLYTSWTASTGATSYTVRYGTLTGTHTTVSQTGIVGLNHTITNGVTGLIAGTTYYVMVQAVNANGTINAPAEMSGVPVTVPTTLSQSNQQHTMCAIMSNGQLRCWGRSRFGNLGNGSESQLGDADEDFGATGVNTISFGTGRYATQIATNGSAEHACAILDNSTVKCWGRNNVGQLGYGDTLPRGGSASTSGNNLLPVDLGANYVPLKVQVGTNFTCVLAEYTPTGNDYLRCWGRGNVGQLGNGGNQDRGDGTNEMGGQLTNIDFGDTNGNGTGTPYQPTDFALGADHGCAILDNGGGVKCWGEGANGRTGRGNQTDTGLSGGTIGNNLTFVSHGGGAAKKISAGSAFACIIDNSDNVRCWGAGGGGRIGYGNTNDIGDNEAPSTAGTVTLGATATLIRSGTTQTCALLTGNSVRCWGTGADGRLGRGNTTDIGDDEVPTAGAATNLGSPQTAVDFAVGANFICAKMSDGTAVCWGDNTYAQLANKDETLVDIGDAGAELGNPLVEIDVGVSRTITSIQASVDLTCILMSDNSSACFGHNIYGKLNIGKPAHTGDEADEMGSFLSQISLGDSSGTPYKATKVAVGLNHICAILDTEQVKCWGRNLYGQLGYGDVLNRGGLVADMGNNLGFVNIGGGRTAKEITAGDNHTCIKNDLHQVKCWGRGNKGQLGYNGTSNIGDNELPSAVGIVNLGAGRTAKTTGTNIMGAGSESTCTIMSDNNVKCWGEGANGRLGTGNTTDIGDTEDPASGNDINLGGGAVSQISVGVTHGCAIMANADLRCWGNGGNGRLGYGNGTSYGDDEAANTPGVVNVGASLTTSQVFTGNSHTCARLSDNTVKCWGQNANGRTGLGTNAGNNTSPTAVDFGIGLTAVSLGGFSAGGCVVTAISGNNELKCWGYNLFGTLGRGDNADRGDGGGEMGDQLQVTPLW